jgi:16S rRNA (cytidine1402-2'-O)-methyltransferase
MSADREDTGRTRPTLYLVATPIGHLQDITLRALQVLKQVDCISCEDTRRTSKLLRHYGIRIPLESHHEHNEARSSARLLAMLRQGKSIALVTDAGTPGISDPGYALVAACTREGIAVVPVPGPCAAVAALAASGLPTDNFYFAGFLPARSAQRQQRLRELASLPCTLILYEAPHRIQASLEDMLDVLGPRRACLAREMTKVHEEWLRGTLSEILEIVRSRSALQGEITLVVDRGEPPPQPASWPESLTLHLEREMRETGAPKNEALKSVARQRGISRKEAYCLLLRERDG